jgi:hypothetical protein
MHSDSGRIVSIHCIFPATKEVASLCCWQDPNGNSHPEMMFAASINDESNFCKC